MMQLLKIESIPIQYQIKVERPRLEVKQAENPSAKMTQIPARLELSSKRIEVRLDTTDMRKSMGLQSVGSMLAQEAQKGIQAAQQATADLSKFGTDVGQIQTGITIAQLVSQKIMQDQQPNVVTAFIPSVGPTITWDPNELKKQYVEGQLSNEWQINQNVLNYIPGKVQLMIEQYPHVEIEYLGEPSYVPPSSNPNYEGESA